jgi:hypothetical protein
VSTWQDFCEELRTHDFAADVSLDLDSDQLLDKTRGLCKAGGMHGDHPNYNKPHVTVEGLHNGSPIVSCVFCGKTLGSLVNPIS